MKYSNNEYDSLEAMLHPDREVEKIDGDGACLFSALCHQLTGKTEDKIKVKQKIISYEEKEKDAFKDLHKIEDTPIDQHLQEFHEDKENKKWGTSTEIAVAATLFGVNIFVASDQYCKGCFKWFKFTPNPKIKETVPEISDISIKEDLEYIVITHINRNHFDSVKALNDAKLPSPTPFIDFIKEFNDILSSKNSEL